MFSQLYSLTSWTTINIKGINSTISPIILLCWIIVEQADFKSLNKESFCIMNIHKQNKL